MTKRPRFILVLAAIWMSLVAPAWAGPVLLISLDGLRPDYVTHADEHGLKIPNLRRFIAEGSYAEGVIGVVPTVTYPSHTTIVTGVWPAEHGIFSNTTFNPVLQGDEEEWYWYGQDIKVRTLWEAARARGMVTASVGWPVTVDARGLQYVIPEYWRVGTTDDRKLIESLSRPVGFLNQLEEKLGPYNEVATGSEYLAGDEVRTKFAVEIIAREKPGFMTIHLDALDHYEHQTGPFSQKSDETLEALDGMVGRLIQAMRANDPAAVVVVVSDHGFASIDHRIDLMPLFAQEGLIKVKQPANSSGVARIASWNATLWAAGATAAVILHDPSDSAVRAHVKAFLDKLKDDPTYGIARVLDHEELTKLGGFPNAAFLVEWKPGYEPGFELTGTVVASIPPGGTHGYLPDRPEMRASFFAMGGDVAAKRDLGLIDMRQIAPTLAGILGASLPSAKAEKLAITR